MVDKMKETIWNMMSEKAVSLAMIYDLEGKILWKKGSRKVPYFAEWL